MCKGTGTIFKTSASIILSTEDFGVLQKRHCNFRVPPHSFKKSELVYSPLGFPGGSDCKETIWEDTMLETQVLGQEDALEKGMAIHSSILAENPMDRGAWRVTVHGVA